MENPRDQHVAFQAVVDDVVLDRDGSNPWPELRPLAAHAGMFRQQIKSVDDVVNESVSGCRAGVLGDIGPDLVEITLGERGQPIGI